MREIIRLNCNECNRANYYQTKNKKLKTGKLITKKFCKFCRNRTDHKEAKV